MNWSEELSRGFYGLPITGDDWTKYQIRLSMNSDTHKRVGKEVKR